MPTWTIVPLSQYKGDRSQFSCGDSALDQFLHTRAGQYERERIGRTFIATSPDAAQIAGYYTLAGSSVPFESVPINVPRHPIPTFLIGRLAVDQRFRGQKLGEYLLFDAFRRARDAANSIAAWAVEVDAYESAIPFYAKYGFRAFKDNPRHLYILMKEIVKFDLGTTS